MINPKYKKLGCLDDFSESMNNVWNNVEYDKVTLIAFAKLYNVIFNAIDASRVGIVAGFWEKK